MQCLSIFQEFQSLNKQIKSLNAFLSFTLILPTQDKDSNLKGHLIRIPIWSRKITWIFFCFSFCLFYLYLYLFFAGLKSADLLFFLHFESKDLES